MWLVDTSVLIDYLRDSPNSSEWCEARMGQLFVSVATAAELFAGVQEGAERVSLDRPLQAVTILPITEEIARRGGLYRRDFGRSHGVGLIDALIAATAEVEGLSLATHNIKHFPMLKNVEAPHP